MVQFYGRPDRNAEVVTLLQLEEEPQSETLRPKSCPAPELPYVKPGIVPLGRILAQRDSEPLSWRASHEGRSAIERNKNLGQNPDLINEVRRKAARSVDTSYASPLGCDPAVANYKVEIFGERLGSGVCPHSRPHGVPAGTGLGGVVRDFVCRGEVVGMMNNCRLPELQLPDVGTCLSGAWS